MLQLPRELNTQNEASTLGLPRHGTDVSPSHKSFELCVSVLFYLVGQRFALPASNECFILMLLIAFACICTVLLCIIPV